MVKRKRSVYSELTFFDSHLNNHKLNEFINSAFDDGGKMQFYKVSDENIICLDIPLGDKNKTKRVYVHISKERIMFRYHHTKVRRLQPYRDALETLKAMVEDGEVRVMRAEGTGYDNSTIPLMVDLSYR